MFCRESDGMSAAAAAAAAAVGSEAKDQTIGQQRRSRTNSITPAY